MARLGQREEKARHSGPFSKEKLQQLQELIERSGDADTAFDDWTAEKLRQESEFAEKLHKRKPEDIKKDENYAPLLPPIADGVLASTRIFSLTST